MESATPSVQPVAQPEAQQNENLETMKLREWLNELEPNKEGVERLAVMIGKCNEVLEKKSSTGYSYDKKYGNILKNTIVTRSTQDPGDFSIKIDDVAFCYTPNKWSRNENNSEALRKVINGATKMKPLWEKITDAYQAVDAVNEYRKTGFPDWHGSPKATKEDYYFKAPGGEFKDILSSLGWTWSFDHDRIINRKHVQAKPNARRNLAYRFSILSRMVPEKKVY